MNAEDVRREVQTHRVSVVCASCERYWQARSEGVPRPRCASRTIEPCASPLAGGDFHDYRGPMQDRSRWCFVCGVEARQVLRALGKSGVAGVCAVHLPLARSLVPVGVPAAAVLIERGGSFVPVDQPVKPSALVREMLATQEEWDYEAAKRG